jgi:hypothetical protein
MNNKVLISQKEGCQRSIGRSIESQRSSASEKTEIRSSENDNSGKDFLQREVGALV